MSPRNGERPAKENSPVLGRQLGLVSRPGPWAEGGEERALDLSTIHHDFPIFHHRPLRQRGGRTLPAMQSLFNFTGGSPPTEADGLVDRATDDLLLGPDWSANVEICDYVMRGNDADVVKAIRRRMNVRNTHVAVLALTLLETCMKNCSQSFHELVAGKEFLGDMARLAKAKGEVGEKALMLIEAWADAFQVEGPPKFKETYNTLRAQGVRAPPVHPRAR